MVSYNFFSVYTDIFRLNEHKETTMAAFKDDFKTSVVIASLIDLIHYMNVQFDKVAHTVFHSENLPMIFFFSYKI